jgi:DNA-binding transcriptional ArsR family regulator
MHTDEWRRGSTSVREKERAGLHPTRIAILDLLSGPGRRELPATAICHELPEPLALSLVVYHLKVLLDVGLVQASGDDPAAPVYSLPALAAPADSGQ